MKERLRQRALELGFDDCRFTSAAAPQSVPRFQQWLAAGRHGTMNYLERNAPKRIDPQQVLPGARSIITLAASYASVPSSEFRVPGSAGHQLGTRNSEAGTVEGVIARYARFADYHDVVRQPLKALAESVNQLGGPATRSLWYVDTGPVLERDLAQRAGLGFIGKHTNLISRRLGNWIFLGEILTTLELEPDAPERNHCGACTRCIAACPTAAIIAPFELDARRCISYLTIEFKDSIPPEFRPQIGTRIFGCDDCLEVCPWNRFARDGRLMKGHARPDLATPDLIELLALDEAGFKRRFAGTPVLRARRRGSLRNVCVALGNTGDTRALPALNQAANDPDPLIAEHARWALERLQSLEG
jgi:epoxyqueuosine reductase